jgi:uncharacterized membrane protein YhaH (DUF805 family)
MENERFFSAQGRLRRRDYAIRIIPLGIIAASINIYRMGPNESTGIMLSLVMFAIAAVSLIQMIKRLHDMNFSGWFSLVSFIPLINLFFGLYVLFKDGTAGSNQYGEDPKDRG